MSLARNTPHTVSRRGFVAGATAAAAATAGVLTLQGCGNSSSGSAALVEEARAQFPGAQVEYLDVADTQVEPHTEMTNVESTEYLVEVNSFDLPIGSLLFQSSDTMALVIAPGSSSRALIRLEFVTLDTGERETILDHALGAGEDYIIYDARASDSALIWIECNMVHGLWRVYASSFTADTTSEMLQQQAHLLDEGGSDHTPPQLAASGNKVYWTVMPDPTGPLSTEDSYLKAAELPRRASGSSASSSTNAPEPYTVYTSHGRMITNPVVSGDVLAFVPRVDTDAVYYQLTTLDITTDEVRNIAILPPSLRVSDAAWMEKGFAFCIEGNYDYAGGLSYFGTYEQLGDDRFLYVNKSPASAPVSIGSLSFVKSTKSVLGINPDYANVAIIDTPLNCVSYGDILAGAGTENRLVLFTTVTARVGQEAGTCHVRVFDVIS